MNQTSLLFLTMLSASILSCAEPPLGPQPTNGSGQDCSTAACGEKLFTDLSCKNCHSTGTDTLFGPGLKGLTGKKRDLTNGQSVIADEMYIRRAISNPSAEIVKGDWGDFMPALTLSESQLDALVAYIATLK